MKNLIISIITLTAGTVVCAVDPFNDGFESGRTQSYLENTGALYEDASMAKIEGMKGKNCLVIKYDNETSADFHPVPVTKGKIYKLSFRGKWANKYTCENNPVMQQACYVSWRIAMEGLPNAEISFLTEDLTQLDSQKFSLCYTMPWGEWKNYTTVFTPPPNATMMQLKIQSGRNPGTFYLDKAEFAEIPWKNSELTLKLSADEPFTGNILGLALEEGSMARENKNMPLSGYGKVSLPIPLANGKYKIEVKGESLQGYHNFDVIFVGADGKDTGKPAISKDILSEPLIFEMPPKADSIKLRIYNHLLDEIKITKI